MQSRSLKIPFGFLITGICWAVFSDKLITILASKTDIGTRDILRSANDFIFVVVITFILYFQIKKKHNLLIASEEQYRKLFELNPNPMWIFHTKSLQFVKVNHAAVVLYGYSLSEFLAMTIVDIRPESDRARLIAYMDELGHGVRNAGTWKHLKKNGELLHVSIVTYDLEFNGQPCSLVMANNITDIVLHEEKIKAQNDILQEIAWSNSHEVRRSLCTVMSLIDLLKNAESEEDYKIYLVMLEQCSSDIDTLIRNNNKKVEKLQDTH